MWYVHDVVSALDEVPFERRPLSSAEFDVLIHAGAFQDEHVELLYGQLVTMSPQGDHHEFLTARLHEALVRQLDRQYIVFGHSTLRMWPHSMPEPDVVVLPRQLIGAPIRLAYLIIEVSESSLRTDTNVKAPLYAEAKIPAYWIVDRPHGVVHLLTEPVDGRYTKFERRGPGELLTCASLPGFAFAIDELFAP